MLYNLFRPWKEGWGPHLNECTARGTWFLPESKLHMNDLELKAVFLALKEFQDPLHTQDSTCSYWWHHSGVIHKQWRRHEVGPTVCSTMENLDWVHQKSSNSQSPTLSRPANVVADKLAKLGQTIQTEWSLLQEVCQTICSGGTGLK